MEEEQQKSEQPTPFKLEQAHKKGMAAKSTDLSAFFALALFSAVLAFTWKGLLAQLLGQAEDILGSGDRVDFGIEAIVHWLGFLGTAGMKIFAPMVLLLMLGSVIGSLVQTGAMFAPSAVKPQWERINPVSGFRKLFSRRGLVEGIKALIKLAVFGAAAYWCLKPVIVKSPLFAEIAPNALPSVIADAVVRVLGFFLVPLALIGVLDTLYVRREFRSKMMMSRRELRDEHKQREGDPRVRSRLRQIRQEMYKRGKSLHKVKDADALITNPTHLAVALRYRRDEMLAPAVLAKGAGDFAKRMREIAWRYNIPIVEDRPLARELFKGASIDAPIPPSTFARVAKILVWAQLQRKTRRGA